MLAHVIYTLSILGVISVGSFVFAQSKGLSFRLFGIFSMSIAAWLFLQYLADAAAGYSLLWLQLASIALSLTMVFFLFFAYMYPDGYVLPRKWIYLGLAPIVFFVPISFTSLYIEKVERSSLGIQVVTGPLFSLQTCVFILFVLLGLLTLLRRLKRADFEHRVRIYLLFAAFSVAIVGGLLSGVVFADNSYWQIARPLSVLGMLLIIVYAMVSHRLFDIRAYAARAVAYSFTFSVITVLYVLALLFAARYVLRTPLDTASVIYLAGATLIAAVSFRPIHLYFNKITNRIFYRDYYEPQDVLDRFNDLLLSASDTRVMQDKSKEILTSAMKPTFVRFYWSNDQDEGQSRFFRSLRNADSDFFALDELDRSKYGSIYQDLRVADAALALRLRTEQGNIGFLVLGAKQSGQPYTQLDRGLLRTIASELAIGFQNAQHLQEIENFNETLQEKIDDATRQLRKKNERLRLLDQTKDDFISMASHQLRTPLTSIKGYVSMVLEGDAGKTTPLQRKLLNQAFVSSQRMVYLISDLLNASRLRTGKFELEPVPTNLAKVITSEIEQLQETAEARKLELVYHQPEHFPTYMLDETKLRQVIMNLVDNAIYYTPSGGHIEVRLSEKPHGIELTVTDDGIGVPKRDQPQMFTKYFRAQNAQVARPDGTGLGLFMAKKVVLAHGGAIIFKSQENKGSTFGFSIPGSALKAPPASAKISTTAAKHTTDKKS